MFFSEDLWKYTFQYSDTDIDSFLTESLDSSDVPEIVGNRTEYINCPASFDIETTSIYRHSVEHGDEYTAIMYHWQFGINGYVILGRTWEQYVEFISKLSSWLGTNENLHLVVYVHNLQFEFQFMKDWFKWDKVFAIKSRKPLYAIDNHGIEYRCSLLLSGYSLDYVGRNLLRTYDCKKRKGDLDYSLVRHTQTELTKEELEYCINDVRVVMCYIQEKIDNGENINDIPLTQTGYVRNYVKKHTLYSNDYKNIIRNIKYNCLDEFIMHRCAYAGGHTHAGVAHVNQSSQLVGSADITSSYPASALLNKFPMSTGTYIGSVRSYQIFEDYMRDYCCVFDIEFVNLKPIFEYENIISLGKGDSVEGKYKGVKSNNGKVIAAKTWCMTINEVDFQYIHKFYKWDKISIKNLWIYQKTYLPYQLIKCILDIYKDKTSLKGVVGKELEYLHAKELLNSIYGMMVTNIIRDTFDFSDYTWSKLRYSDEEAQNELDKYNTKFDRFLAYHWGMYITSYSRARLYDAILEFGSDFIYCDTDSIKGINFKDHLDYFEKCNQEILNKINTVAKHYNLDPKLFSPTTVKGKAKPIGLWEIEHENEYLYFKSCGAKRYVYIPVPDSNLEFEIWVDAYKEFHSDIPTSDYQALKTALAEFKKEHNTSWLVSFTCSGINKSKALPWLWNEFNSAKIIFEYFGEGFIVIPEYSGKLTSHIIDEPKLGYITDYNGVKARYFERSGNCLEPAPYYMSIAREYMNYIDNFKNGIEWMEEMR